MKIFIATGVKNPSFLYESSGCLNLIALNYEIESFIFSTLVLIASGNKLP